MSEMTLEKEKEAYPKCPNCGKAEMELASLKIYRVESFRTPFIRERELIDHFYVDVLYCPKCRHIEFLR